MLPDMNDFYSSKLENPPLGIYILVKIYKEVIFTLQVI